MIRMSAKKHTPSTNISLGVVGMTIGVVIGAFILGIHTAGDVAPIVPSIEADGLVLEGDMNGNNVIDADDALIAFAIARGDHIATPHQLLADPTANGHITFDDVRMILGLLSHTPNDTL